VKIKLTSDKIYNAIILILPIFWSIYVIPATLRLLCGEKNSLLTSYRLFANKTENERLKIIEPDFFPTIALGETSVPPKEKLLIISFPYKLSYHFRNDQAFRIEYYLYPRFVYWYSKEITDTNNIIELCKAKNFNYCITYDDAKKPVLVKVKQ